MSEREGNVRIFIERGGDEIAVEVACSADWSHPSDLQAEADEIGIAADGKEWALLESEQERAAEQFADHVSESFRRQEEMRGDGLDSWKARREEMI